MQSRNRAMALAILTLVLSSAVAGAKNVDGVQTAEFKTSAGKVRVYLPSDMRGGDTISGTVLAEPVANDPTKRDEIGGYVLDLSGQKTPVSNGVFKWAVPAGAGSAALFLRSGSGKEIGKTVVSLGNVPPVASTTTGCPQLAQAGKPLLLTVHADPSKNMQALVNGQQSPILCASPRQTVIMPPKDLLGSATIELTSDGQSVSQMSTNMFTVDLSTPRSTLVKGERTWIEIKIHSPGARPFPGYDVHLENLTPNVVRFNEATGRMLEKHVVESDFNGDGVATVTVSLTALTAGGFAIEADVKGGRCGKEKSVTLIEALKKGHDNKGYFVAWKEVEWVGHCVLKAEHPGSHRYSWKKGDGEEEKKEYFDSAEERDSKFRDMEAEKKKRDAEKDAD